MKNDIDANIKEIIIDLAKEDNLKEIKLNSINRSSLLIDDFGFDSFNLAQLTVILEDKYGIDVFEESIIRTYGELIDKIK